MSELINKINLRFESGNSVPVDSVRITREEWGAVQRELETYRAAEQMQIALRRKADEERDTALYREAALAAHVDRVLGAWMYDDTGIHDKYEHYVKLPTARYEAVDAAIMDSPDASLKRRDLIKQAEALENMAESLNSDCHCDTWMNDRAADLRQRSQNL